LQMRQDYAGVDLSLVFKKRAAELLRLEKRAGRLDAVDRFSVVSDGLGRFLGLKKKIRYLTAGLLDDKRMLQALDGCGALARLLPEVRADYAALARAAAAGAPLTVRFALLAWSADEAALATLCERLRVPNDERGLALIGCRLRAALRSAAAAPAGELLALLKAGDALRRPARFRELLDALRLGSWRRR